MAVIATIETEYGLTQALYVRLNNFEQLANHGVPAVARFRGFASEEAFEEGKSFLWERLVEFEADAPTDPWALAYTALKATDRTPETMAAVEEAFANREALIEAAGEDEPDAAALEFADNEIERCQAAYEAAVRERDAFAEAEDV